MPTVKRVAAHATARLSRDCVSFWGTTTLMYFPGLFKPADSSKSVLKPGLLGTPAKVSRQYCLCAARLIYLGLETLLLGLISQPSCV